MDRNEKTYDYSLPIWIAFALMIIAIVLAGADSFIPALIAFVGAVAAFVTWRRQGAPPPFAS